MQTPKLVVIASEEPLGDAEKADLLAGVKCHGEFVDALQDEAMVLLKNTGVLPLDVMKTKKILVTGPLADESNFMSSRYGPNGIPPTSILKGLKTIFGVAETMFTVQQGADIISHILIILHYHYQRIGQ